MYKTSISIKNTFIFNKLSNHANVSRRSKPKNILKFVIQFPGLGSIFIIFGKIKKHMYGVAKPNEIARNIVMII